MSPTSHPPRRRRLVGVSTKMYFSHHQTKAYITALLSSLSALSPEKLQAVSETVDVFFIPDHVSITTAVSQLQGQKSPVIQVGAQDAYSEDKGAFTGEVSPAVLAEVGCTILELGHAERRRLFGEDDESTALKAAAAARNGIVPLVCIGEPVKPASLSAGTMETDGEETLDVKAALPQIIPQISSLLTRLPASSSVVLAYEPVWAIGAPAPASASYVKSMAREIRRLECVRERPRDSVRILYGGSAGPGLFDKLRDDEGEGGADGLFLGRFAHDPDAFIRTICEVAGVGM